MLDFLRDNIGQILDGLLFGLGVLAVYLGAVFTGALIRSLGGAGSKGLTVAGRYLQGWFYYLRGDNRDIVNVTLNMVVDNQLKFDTLVADRRIWFVWPNAYQQGLIRAAARRTTEDNPVIAFAERVPQPRTLIGRARRRCGDWLHDLLASAKVVRNGKQRRVRLQREDDYKATYGPLISLVSEKCSNTDSLDLALGRPMDEYRLVIALTYEKLSDRRARHLRAMVMWEQSLLNLPAQPPRFERREHATRFRTLQVIAAQYRAHPERFGIVHIWRPKGLYPTAAAAEVGIGRSLPQAVT
ncbi:MAG: hypothetical protein IT536_08970 [Hyphomicrobiales bacterium]|nr:hypothetical protein [Hyphomicrobiales bacterium]